MWDYSISQEIGSFSVYITSESFVECVWIHLGANIPAACSLTDLYVQSVSPHLIVGNIYSWPAAVGLLVLPSPARRVSIASLNSVQHRADPNIFNSESSKFASSVTLARERRTTCSSIHTMYVGLPSMMQIQFMKPTLYELQYEHNRHTISYMFRHCLSAIIRGSVLLQLHHHGGTQEMPKHVADCVSAVFISQCMQVRFDKPSTWRAAHVYFVVGISCFLS